MGHALHRSFIMQRIMKSLLLAALKGKLQSCTTVARRGTPGPRWPEVGVCVAMMHHLCLRTTNCLTHLCTRNHRHLQPPEPGHMARGGDKIHTHPNCGGPEVCLFTDAGVVLQVAHRDLPALFVSVCRPTARRLRIVRRREDARARISASARPLPHRRATGPHAVRVWPSTRSQSDKDNAKLKAACTPPSRRRHDPLHVPIVLGPDACVGDSDNCNGEAGPCLRSVWGRRTARTRSPPRSSRVTPFRGRGAPCPLHKSRAIH